MSFDYNKYCCMIIGTLLGVIILFTNFRICIGEKTVGISATSVIVKKEYQGEGCSKLKYINIDSVDKEGKSNCPGEGNFAIAQQCLEYVECVPNNNNTNISSSELYLMDYFRICDEGQYFNGTGCSIRNANNNNNSTDDETRRDDDECVQLHCHIIEISMENESDMESIVTEMAGNEGILIDGDEAFTTESSSNSTQNSSSSTNSFGYISSTQIIILFLSTIIICIITF